VSDVRRWLFSSEISSCSSGNGFGLPILSIKSVCIFILLLYGGRHSFHEKDPLEEFRVQPILEIFDEGLVISDPAFADQDPELGDVIVYSSQSLFQMFDVGQNQWVRRLLLKLF
jgi:hypothetical protein